MCALHHTAKAAGVLAILLAACPAYAEINHTGRMLKGASESQSPEKNIHGPEIQPDTMTTVAYLEESHVKFNVDIEDSTERVQLFQALPTDDSVDNMELKAGLSYTNPDSPTSKFYFNYSMSSGPNHPALQDRSSERDYSLNQQARLGIAIGF